MIYAGMGSRETPREICDKMRDLAALMAWAKITLHSGGAVGADKAFEMGCNAVCGDKRIFTVRDIVNSPNKIAYLNHAANFHPAWFKCPKHARLLHARNSLIMLGLNLNCPVDFVICWTKDGAASGGTGQALRIAHAHAIPIFNLYYITAQQSLNNWLNR